MKNRNDFKLLVSLRKPTEESNDFTEEIEERRGETKKLITQLEKSIPKRSTPNEGEQRKVLLNAKSLSPTV